MRAWRMVVPGERPVSWCGRANIPAGATRWNDRSLSLMTVVAGSRRVLAGGDFLFVAIVAETRSLRCVVHGALQRRRDGRCRLRPVAVATCLPRLCVWALAARLVMASAALDGFRVLGMREGHRSSRGSIPDRIRTGRIRDRLLRCQSRWAVRGEAQYGKERYESKRHVPVRSGSGNFRADLAKPAHGRTGYSHRQKEIAYALSDFRADHRAGESIARVIAYRECRIPRCASASRASGLAYAWRRSGPSRCLDVHLARGGRGAIVE